MIELLVVLAIVGLALGLGIPALHNFIVRSRTEGFAREVSMLLQRSRLEAIKSNRQVAVFIDGDTLISFVDQDRNEKYEPDDSKPYKSVDWVVAKVENPGDHVAFIDPDHAEGAASIAGFTDFDDRTAAVFQPNGSVVDIGAFRVGDVRRNFLEIRVAPAASGRIEVRKWHEDRISAETDDHWIESGDPSDPDYEPWKWN